MFEPFSLRNAYVEGTEGLRLPQLLGKPQVPAGTAAPSSKPGNIGEGKAEIHSTMLGRKVILLA